MKSIPLHKGEVIERNAGGDTDIERFFAAVHGDLDDIVAEFDQLRGEAKALLSKQKDHFGVGRIAVEHDTVVGLFESDDSVPFLLKRFKCVREVRYYLLSYGQLSTKGGFMDIAGQFLCDMRQAAVIGLFREGSIAAIKHLGYAEAITCSQNGTDVVRGADIVGYDDDIAHEHYCTNLLILMKRLPTSIHHCEF